MRSATLALVLAGAIAATAVFGGDTYRVLISSQKKRLDVERKHVGNMEKVEEKWGYTITLANQSFKDVPDLEAEYIVFYKIQIPGRMENATKPKRSIGKHSVGLLKNNDKVSFDTDPIDLQKTRLDSDWFYGTGAKNQAKDVITGIMVRVKSGGTVVAEFADPQSLKTSEKWD